jgi:hypothetical protein
MGEYWTRYYAQAYGLNGDYMWAIAQCESGGDPYVYNAQDSGAAGLFQFMPETYYANRLALNMDTTLAPGLISFDPEYRDMFADGGAAEAHLAAWMFYRGKAGEWACTYLVGS